MCATEAAETRSEGSSVRLAMEADGNVVEREHEVDDAERGKLTELGHKRAPLGRRRVAHAQTRRDPVHESHPGGPGDRDEPLELGNVRCRIRLAPQNPVVRL